MFSSSHIRTNWSTLNQPKSSPSAMCVGVSSTSLIWQTKTRTTDPLGETPDVGRNNIIYNLTSAKAHWETKHISPKPLPISCSRVRSSSGGAFIGGYNLRSISVSISCNFCPYGPNVRNCLMNFSNFWGFWSYVPFVI